MKILLVSDGPWHPTGYGVQTKYLADLLADDGHRVYIYCAGAFMGGKVQWRDGVTVIGAGGGDDRWGNRSVSDLVDWVQPDVILTWLDVHGMVNYGWFTQPMYCWTPVDSDPLPKEERAILGRAHKILVPSRWGQEVLKREGFESDYVPCGIDANLFDIDREGGRQWRKQFSPEIDDDTFLIGMVGLNTGSPDRKGYGYAFDVIKNFHDRHPDEKFMVYMHTDPGGDGVALPLPGLREELGLLDYVAFAPPQLPWGHSPLYLRHMFNAFDVYLHTSLTEGFGVPVIEAQACGVPVVANAATSVSELTTGQYQSPPLAPMWVNTVTRIYIPHVEGLTNMLESAYQDWKAGRFNDRQRQIIRERVLQYEWKRVYETHWRPALADVPPPIDYEQAGGELGPKLMLGCGAERGTGEGWVHHDREKFSPDVDVAHDLTVFPWPWARESIGYVEMSDVLEHLRADMTQVMDELWRILKPGGYVYIHTAEAGSWQLIKDPTHVIGFYPSSFNYYDPETMEGQNYNYTDKKWRIVRRTQNNAGLVFVLQPRKPQVVWEQHFGTLVNGETVHIPEKCKTCSQPTLDQFFIKNNTDKSSLFHNYAPAYERCIDRSKVKRMLEIGVWTGGSLRAWRDWLPEAEIWGVDIQSTYFNRLEQEGFRLVAGDITKQATIDQLPESFDFIVDDGSHLAADVEAAFAMLWPRLAPGGWYVVEDIGAMGQSVVPVLTALAERVERDGELLLLQKPALVEVPA